MKIRTTTYELKLLDTNYKNDMTGLERDKIVNDYVANYGRMIKALQKVSVVHSHQTQSNISEQFLMPGGKITLQIRSGGDHPDNDNKTYMDVIRTCRFRPKYLNNIVDKLGGVEVSRSVVPFNPAATLDLYLTGHKK